GADPGGPQRVQAASGADRPPSDAARLWSRSAAADYGQVGPGGVTATREGRASARPLHRAGARRSQEARRSREFDVAGRVFRGLPGRGEHWLVHFIELVLDVPGSSTFSGSSVFSGVGSPGLPGRDEHWLVRVIELVLDVPRKRDQEARRSPVVAFQSNNPKVMRLQIERLGCCSSRWGARMSLGRALRAFWYCCSISRSICVSRFIDGGVSALSSRPVVMDLNQPASFCAGSTW